MSSLFIELTEVAKIHPEPGETAGAFSIRLADEVDAVCDRDESIWRTLSGASQRWVNHTLEALNVHQDDEDFLPDAVPGFIAVPAEVPEPESDSNDAEAEEQDEKEDEHEEAKSTTPKVDGEIEAHEFAKLFPAMPADKLQDLVDDVR